MSVHSRMPAPLDWNGLRVLLEDLEERLRPRCSYTEVRSRIWRDHDFVCGGCGARVPNDDGAPGRTVMHHKPTCSWARLRSTLGWSWPCATNGTTNIPTPLRHELEDPMSEKTPAAPAATIDLMAELKKSLAERAAKEPAPAASARWPCTITHTHETGGVRATCAHGVSVLGTSKKDADLSLSSRCPVGPLNPDRVFADVANAADALPAEPARGPASDEEPAPDDLAWETWFSSEYTALYGGTAPSVTGEERDRVQRVYDAAIAWVKDTGFCHFCAYSPAEPIHLCADGEECPLAGTEKP